MGFRLNYYIISASIFASGLAVVLASTEARPLVVTILAIKMAIWIVDWAWMGYWIVRFYESSFTLPKLIRHMFTDDILPVEVRSVLLPTRELAVQVEETFRKVGGPSGLRTAIVIGGTNINPQKRSLKNKPHVIVATPGRLIDHIEQGNIKLDNVGILVLDEADRMLDMGFAPQLNKIMTFIPEDRQTMLFSATMPDEIAQMARKYMKTPLRIEVSRPLEPLAEKIDQEVFIVSRAEKLDLLKRLLQEYKGQVPVFSRTKYGAKKNCPCPAQEWS